MATVTVDAAVSDSAVDVEQMFDTSMHMIEEVARIVHQTENDCEAMAYRLDEYDKRNAEFIERAKHVYDTMPAEEKKALQKRHRARFKAAWDELRPGGLKCKENDRVRTVADDLFRGRRD